MPKQKKRTGIMKSIGAAAMTLSLVASTPMTALAAEQGDTPEEEGIKQSAEGAPAKPTTVEEARQYAEECDAARSEKNAQYQAADDALESGKQEIESAEGGAAEATQAFEDADANAAAAFGEAKQAAADELVSAEEDHGRAESERVDASGKVEEAEREVADKEGKAQEAADELERVSGGSSVSAEDVEKAKADRDEAQAAADDAGEDLRGAQDRASNAGAAYQEAAESVERATEVSEKTQAYYDEASKKLDEANEALDEAERAYQAAVEADESAREAAEARVDAANESYEQAVGQLGAARTALDGAQQADTAAQSALESAREEKDAATAELEAAQENADTTSAVLSEAQAAAEEAEAHFTEASENKKVADAALAEAKEKYDQSYSEYRSVLQRQKDAQAACDEAEQAYIAARDFIPENGIKSSKEFFEFLGDQEAVDVITGYSGKIGGEPIVNYTHIGEQGDATSAENLRVAIRMLRDCNAIRATLGLNELKVTNYLMAGAELNVNWSDSSMDHSGAFPASENLAWGYKTDPYDIDKMDIVSYTNPFEGWYDEEKKLWDKYVAQYPELEGLTGSDLLVKASRENNQEYYDIWNKTGHYLNMTNPNAQATGFAYSTDPNASYSTAFSQTFSSNIGNRPSYTVDEYEALLEEALGITDEMRNDTSEKLAALAAAQETVKQMKQEYQDARSIMLGFQSDYNEKKQVAADAKSAFADANVERVNANSNYSNARAADKLAQAELNLASKKKSEADAAYEQCESDAQTAADNLAGAQDAFTAAVSALDAATTEKDEAEAAADALVPTADGLSGALEEARGKQAVASKDFEQGKQANEEAIKSLAEARDRMAGAQEEYDDASTALEQARSAEGAAAERAREAQAEFERIDAFYGAVKAVSEVYENAREEAEAAQAALSKAKDDLAKAQQRYDQAQQRLDQANLDAADAAELIYEGLNTGGIASGKFGYLNDMVNAVKKAYDDLQQANHRLDEARDALPGLQIARDDAYSAYVDSEANYALAQGWLAELIEKQEPDPGNNPTKENPNPSGGKDKGDNKIHENPQKDAPDLDSGKGYSARNTGAKDVVGGVIPTAQASPAVERASIAGIAKKPTGVNGKEGDDFVVQRATSEGDESRPSSKAPSYDVAQNSSETSLGMFAAGSIAATLAGLFMAMRRRCDSDEPTG